MFNSKVTVPNTKGMTDSLYNRFMAVIIWGDRLVMHRLLVARSL